MQIIQENNVEKLINKVALEIYNAATVKEETIYLNQPYFAQHNNPDPNIPFDPFRQQIKKFDYNFVLGDMKRFVTYHINKTLGIVSKDPYGKRDPMVSPIAEKLTSAFYKDALKMGYVEENPNIEKQSWYYGSIIKYHLDETIMDDILLEQFKKDKSGSDKFINNVVKDMIKDIIVEEDFIHFAMPYNEKLYPSQVRTGIVINYYRWFENAVESLWHRETILEDISKMVQHHFGEAYGIPWKDTYDNTVIPISLKLYDIIVKRLHKLWDKKSLNESVINKNDDFYSTDTQRKQYHKNGFINRVVGDFLKLTEVDGSSVVFHTVELMLDTNKQHWNNPSLYFVYDTNGLTKESIDIIHEGVSNGVHWYMEEMGLLSSKDDPTVTIISDILISEIIKGIENYMEDDRWVGEDWRDSIYLTESKQDQYREYIIKDLVANTTIDYIMGRFEIFPQINDGWGAFFHSFEDPPDFDSSVFLSLKNFLKRTYGIIDKEFEGLWVTYRKIMLDKIISNQEKYGEWGEERVGREYREDEGESITESTDKQEQYINDVLKHLMDNTKWGDASYSQLFLNDHISMTAYINYGDYEFTFIPRPVVDILKGFGLTKQETDEVWDFYSRWVLEKVMREGNVNWPNRENHKKRYSFMNESKIDIDKDKVFAKSSKFAEKIAKEIIDASTLTGDLLTFYPPVIEDDKYESPISADVNSEWIQGDNSTGIYHLQDDIRRIGRNYIKKILSFGVQQRNDPIFKQVNDIVIDNILQRARNHDWMKEIEKLKGLKDKHGFIRESAQPKYLDKIFNSLTKEIRFDGDKHVVIIPFIDSENYSMESGELELGEYSMENHNTLALRNDGSLHKEFRSYLEEIYGLSIEEADEVFEMVRQYIKDELYYIYILQQILWAVQDDYIQGYGAKIEVTPERTIDLKNYNEFKEYLNWWHGIEEPDYDGDGVGDITDNLVKRLYDEVWSTLKNTITLNEGWPSEPELDEEGNKKWDRMFPDKFYLKIFNMIDKDPEYFMKEVLENLGFEPEEEYDILYNYFVNYSDRKDYYLDFTIDPQDIASFFSDRDYGMEEMVKNYLSGEWDYIDWYHESFQFDDYFLDSINDGSWVEIAKILKVDNIADAEELVSGNIESEHLEDQYELMEDTIEDVQNIIAHSMTEAQADADMAYLHEDILDEINDFFKHGKFNFDQGEFVGSVELGDVFEKGAGGLDELESDLQEGYPTFDEVMTDLLSQELNDWGYSDRYVFTGDEKPNIDTDKHFRYGGAGTLNEVHFNDMLVDRLSWDY